MDDRVFKSFVKHINQAVYNNIYKPNHPTTNADSFRDDILTLVHKLSVTIIHYPNNNFVSNYN